MLPCHSLETGSDWLNRKPPFMKPGSFIAAVLFFIAAAPGVSGLAQEEPSGAEEKRILRLFEEYKCDCDKEDWTRTLFGCFEPCADRQRNLIRKLVADGASDEEIREKMIADAGTEKVLARPHFLPNLIPYGLLALLGCGVLLTLTRMRNQTRIAKETESGRSPALQGDSDLEDRIEAELSRLKD